MTPVVSPYLPVLLSFGPLFMILGRLPPPAGPLALSLIVATLPYIGAAMVSIGATSLLNAMRKQQKELADLRTKLIALESR